MKPSGPLGAGSRPLGWAGNPPRQLIGGKRRNGGMGGLRPRIAWVLDRSILVLVAIVMVLVSASALAPRLQASVQPSRIDAEEGRAFTFGPDFQTHWPFVVPSHPDFELGADDVEMLENGTLFGRLEPSHDTIRRLGEGRYNLWQGGLWFSTRDNTDPRTNGRSYAVRVKARLNPTAALVLLNCVAALVVLVLCRAKAALTLFLALADQRWSLASRARSHVAALSRWTGPVSALAGRVPLTFGIAFGIFCALMLATFGWSSLARPMPLVFGPDSFTYVWPGVLLDAGQRVAEQSSRDVGYPALTFVALRLGSLSMIPLLQLFIVIAGVACVLSVLYLMLAAAMSRLSERAGVPKGILAFCGCLAAAMYCIMIVGHDSFILDIYRAMAEAPHFLPTALALLLFVGGWTARTPARRLGFMILSVPTAYLSTMVKPHTLVVLGLCSLGLGATALRHHRAFRSPLVLSVCVLSTMLIVSVHRFDAWVTPSGFDFGPKTLFCNHLDVEQPVFDASTPERSHVKDLMRGVLQNPDRWPLLGFTGDLCMYGEGFNRALEAAAKSEGLTAPAWEQREFVRAVVNNPAGYALAVLNQLVYFMIHPVGDVEDHGKGVVTDDEWRSLTPYLNSIRMRRDQFNVEVSSWVPSADPRLAALGKSLLQVVSSTFALVTLGSTLVATMVAVAMKGRGDIRLEITMLAVAGFTAAFVMTPALAHTFDVRRYLVDILPFSLLWWVMGIAYLAHCLVLLNTRAARQGGHSGEVVRPWLSTAGEV